MYLQNKYTRWYYSIIDRAKIRSIDNSIYIERHHIIPKSLGGDNSPENLSRLTAREHLICHKLLVHMLPSGPSKRKMIMARFRMTHKSKNNQRCAVNSREYERFKLAWVKALSESKKGKPGFKRSAKTRAKMSESRKGRTFSDESREKMRLAALGRKHTQETKEKFAKRINNRLGVVLSDETKEKMRQAAKGRVFSEQHKLALKKAAKNRKKHKK
jgi:hypothetical protein